MNDTTQYGFYKTQSSNESYKPFQLNDKDNNGHNEDNHNGHGNGHTEHGNGHGNGHNDGVPIYDGFFILMIFIGFYLIYKYFKNNKS